MSSALQTIKWFAWGTIQSCAWGWRSPYNPWHGRGWRSSPPPLLPAPPIRLASPSHSFGKGRLSPEVLARQKADPAWN